MRDKKTFISIIVLLIIYLPMAVYGTVNHIKNNKVLIDNNDNKDFIFKNKVYYYENDVLNSTYECVGTCTEAATEIRDEIYNIHYYSKGEEKAPTILSNGYAIFDENQSIALYSFPLKKKILEFGAIKTYNIPHSEPILIVSVGAKMGVISLDSMTPVIATNYDFIGIPNRVQDGTLDTSRFIAKDGPYWYVLESDGTYRHEPMREPIVDFNSQYIIINNGGIYKIVDYEQVDYFSDVNFKDVYCIGEYVVTINEENTMQIYSDLTSSPLKIVDIPEYTKMELEIIDNKINLFLDGGLNQNIDMNQL